MGSRFGIIAVSPAVSAERIALALGAESVEQVGPKQTDPPYEKTDLSEAFFLERDGWSVLICAFNAGVLDGYDATPLVAMLKQAQELRYFGQEDTNAELLVQCFKGGRLEFSHFEHEGFVEANRSIGPTPPKDKYGQTDEYQLLASILPFELADAFFERFALRWKAR